MIRGDDEVPFFSFFKKMTRIQLTHRLLFRLTCFFFKKNNNSTVFTELFYVIWNHLLSLIETNRRSPEFQFFGKFNLIKAHPTM